MTHLVYGLASTIFVYFSSF